MKIVYVNDTYQKEEELLKKYGIPCIRIEYPGYNDGIDDGVLFRGPKMNTEGYSNFLLEVGVKNPLVSVNEYSIAADAALYSHCFGKYSPKVISFDINESIENISDAIRNVAFPLFVRSNVESAAKYVGVEACILKSVDSIVDVLQPIKKYIKSADKIIMKEVIPLKTINNQTVEYRAIVISDQLVCFDYNSSCGLPDPTSLKWKEVLDCASTNGLHGAYFLDLGVSESDELFVVECKNLFNGTIKNIARFAEGLLRC